MKNFAGLGAPSSNGPERRLAPAVCLLAAPPAFLFSAGPMLAQSRPHEKGVIGRRRPAVQ